jgi:hypothetical protein
LIFFSTLICLLGVDNEFVRLVCSADKRSKEKEESLVMIVEGDKIVRSSIVKKLIDMDISVMCCFLCVEESVLQTRLPKSEVEHMVTSNEAEDLKSLDGLKCISFPNSTLSDQKKNVEKILGSIT